MTDEQIEALKSVRSIVQSVGLDEEEIGMIVALRKFLIVAESRADFFNKFGWVQFYVGNTTGGVIIFVHQYQYDKRLNDLYNDDTLSDTSNRL